MPIKAPKKEGGDFEIAPAGNHIARLYRIINLGNVPFTFQGEGKRGPKVRLYFELSNEMIEYEKDGQKLTKPFSVSAEYTLSMHKKAQLRKIVEGVVGEALDDEEAWEFDIESLLGKVTLLNVIHKASKDGQKTYANIAGTSPLPKGMEAPAIVNQPSILDVNTATLEEIEDLPDFLKDAIKSSTEFYNRFLSPVDEEPSIDMSEEETA